MRVEKSLEVKKIYKWNVGRLMVFLISALNTVLVSFVLYQLVFDNYFLKNQLGITSDLEIKFRVAIAVICLLLTLFLNYRLIAKDIISKHIVSIVQTVGYAFVIRNLIVSFIFDGFNIQNYYMQVVALVIMSALIYMTIFSVEGLIYFGLADEKKA